jgi:hypothetical protein
MSPNTRLLKFFTSQIVCGIAMILSLFALSVSAADPPENCEVAEDVLISPAPPCECEEENCPHKWRDLFDGESLEGWKLVEKWDFKGHGEVKVEDKIIHFGTGDPFTGLLFKGEDFPRVDYELIFEAKRTEGDDFFLGVVFPFGDDQLSFVCGGWGGEVVGITSVDGEPAVENQTAQYVEFENDRWYTIRLRVINKNVSLWVDEEHLVDLDRDYHDFTIYWEQEPLLPFGFSSWNTGSAYRTIRVRKLTPDELKNEDDES